MTYPRSHLLSPDGGGVYHVHSRCVRRAWLCGVDEASGRDFSHRRAWIEQRILTLSEVFCVAVYGYAVMSNHYHIVLRLEPERCKAWSDEEVAERWLTLCPGSRPRNRKFDNQLRSLRKSTLLQDSVRLLEIRRRLSSLSWFMRFINEPLARLANREDECTGRFWEGRFKSQLLLDEPAILACMVYVDLNPVRAGIARDVDECDFTSLHRRMRLQHMTTPVGSLNTSALPPPFVELSLGDYVDLVRWTAREQRNVRRDIAHVRPASLDRAGVVMDQWFGHFLPVPRQWRRAVGSLQAMKQYAQSIGQRWIRHQPVVRTA